MNRSLFLWLLVAVLVLSGCAQENTPTAPNIILILADDLGYNDLSCYRATNLQRGDRSPTCQTPNIDRLSDEGMRFTDFYCGAAVCSPSRSSLLTGRNCTRVGIYNWIPPRQPMHLRSEEVTLAEMLKQADYQTGHFGKWHLTAEGMGQPLPMDQGFDYAFYTYNNADPSHRNPDNFFRNGIREDTLTGYSCQLVVDEALDWLRKREGQDVPFYINIWFNEPHEKVAAPEKLSSKHTYKSEYYGCIENMDLAVGRILSYLQNQGLEEETLVIFTSDNGSKEVASNDPLRGEKAFNYEGGIRVPFLIRWPGKVPAGQVISSAGSFTDLLPSLATLTGVTPPEDRKLDGEDISRVFLGEADTYRRSAPLFFFRYFHDPVCMLREGNWVLLGYQDEPPPYVRDYSQPELARLKPHPDSASGSMWRFQSSHMEYLLTAIPLYFELYQVVDDISQNEDLSSRYPDRVKQMKSRMLSLREEMIDEGGNWYE